MNKTGLSLLFLSIIIFLHIYLLSRLIFFPYPELFIYPYLTNQGLFPYKQIFDQHFPGLMFFPVNLASLGMDTPADARYWQYATIFITHIVLFLIAKKLLKSEAWALFINLLYLIWQPFFEGYVLWIDLFVVPVLLAAFYFFISTGRRGVNYFYSGLFLGIGLLFKQVVLPLIIVLNLYLFLKSNYKSILYLVSGFMIPITFLLLFIVIKGIWTDFFYWTVTFNLTTFAQMGRKYPQWTDLVKTIPLFGVGFFSLILMLFKKIYYPSVIILIFLTGTLAFVYARFDSVHLQPALPFAVLGLVYFLTKVSGSRRVLLAGLFLLFSLFLTLNYYKNIKGPGILFFGEFENKITQKVLNLTNPNDKVFAFGVFPHLNQQTSTLPPGNLYVFQFPWFMVEAEDKILSGLVNEPPKLVVRDTSITISNVNVVDFMPKIHKFINNNYKIEDRVGSAEILILK